jgi:5'-nucleotidase
LPIRLRPRSRSRSLAQVAVLALVASPLAVLATAGPAHAAPVDIQILATNDFHGRLLPNGAEGGAAVLSGAVKQLKSENPNTVFTAAGDLIGASTFESFIADDEPTIDVLNEAGLEVSAAGNHEFDQGYDDLVGRVQDRANWEYIAANIIEPAGADELAESWVKDFGDVEVGFVGAVTEDLPSLVSPAGIAGVTVTDIVAATNAEATALEAAGADLIVLLVHEGAPGTSLASATDPTNAFGAIVNGVSPDVDAIVSGHTHLAYNHSVPVPAWANEGRAVTERPVVSAGQYGSFLNQLVFTVDTTTGDVAAKTQAILPMVGPDPDGSGPAVGPALYPADPATKTIVDAAVANAEVLGSQPLGEVAGAFNRAKLANGTTENRGGESTLGNLVAEVQQWATETPEAGASQIAFMNPGGLRGDMTGTGTGAFPRTLTYKQAASVQPFANTLVNMDLTGAQIKEALEQQWQRDAAGNVPTRAFLRLGASEGFTYTYDPNLAEGSRITGMWLHGAEIDPAATYSVTVNSFLASGGDNFRAFAGGTDKKDTGKIDLQAMVDYMAAFAAHTPLPVDSTQRAVGVSFRPVPDSDPRGRTVSFDLSSLSFTSASDVRDQQVSVSLGNKVLGVFPVTTVIQAALPGFDEAGTSSVKVRLPASTPLQKAVLTVTGLTTGTKVTVPALKLPLDD